LGAGELVSFRGANNSRSPAGGQNDVVAGAPPGYQQRAPRHGAAPGEAGPAHVVWHDHLNDGIIRRVALGGVWDCNAEGDAAPIGLVELEVGREDQPGVRVLIYRVGGGAGRGCCVPQSVLLAPSLVTGHEIGVLASRHQGCHEPKKLCPQHSEVGYDLLTIEIAK
jgi:hypothetical protein